MKLTLLLCVGYFFLLLPGEKLTSATDCKANYDKNNDNHEGSQVRCIKFRRKYVFHTGYMKYSIYYYNNKKLPYIYEAKFTKFRLKSKAFSYLVIKK